MWENPFYVVAFILGFVIIGLSLMMFLLPKKNSHLVIKLIFDLTYIVQMIFIFLATHTYLVFAMIASNCVGAIRDVAFIKVEKDEHRFYWTLGLCALMILLLHFSYSTPISYLPIVGTLINTTALSIKEKRKTCALTLVGQVFFITYYVLLLKESDFLTVLNIIGASLLFISALGGLILSFKKIKLSTKNA